MKIATKIFDKIHQIYEGLKPKSNDKRSKAILALYAARQHYRQEFGLGQAYTYHLPEARLQGAVACEHIIPIHLEYAVIGATRDLHKLRALVTIAEAAECHCADLEILQALYHIGIDFSFEDLAIWRKLLVEGRLEEVLYLEYAVVKEQDKVHPFSDNYTPPPSPQTKSSTPSRLDSEPEAIIEPIPGTPQEDLVQDLRESYREIRREELSEIRPIHEENQREHSPLITPSQFILVLLRELSQQPHDN
jgi:hypothetical protein